MRILSIDSSLGTQLLVADVPDHSDPGADPTALSILTASGQDSPRRHAESLGPMLAAALADPAVAAAPLDVVVAATGPAPFTGLRAGLVTARAVGRARSIPVYGVPSLDAVARAALDELARRDRASARSATVLVATDARRKEVYTALFRARGADDVERLGEYEVLAPAGLRQREESGGQPPADVVAGSGVALYPELAAGREALAPVSGDAAAQVRIALARLRALDGAGEESLQQAGLGTAPLYLRRADVHLAGRAR
ncbi:MULTISPECIES: tRNA (adenosine(37)-N6)-threonylcarbamoyltransferase complex dimerization subunit type 1 TsaB [unclassified Actinomyces]|uniref:tRNA (adenosine(37)-N6)-threonylcarbamoyltransferase complex dimerization subunit type 1 TsaB n=1 Tax=unclassified Actinomyces TaxID=2609248 RepID=UPI000D5A2404|nr:MULTISPECIES: tRNA (adenosine(37)-N6)-threonylcarbamoyltransferase complex dimerization subunit type 1 TsaB [unclassified Actinomyces]RAX22156.1 tRNA (adenosine(37)-N6)-threonylcarbamoyltransferase complex dimerization subunit type 1 TsaB [Actinomyces sp. Z3]